MTRPTSCKAPELYTGIVLAFVAVAFFVMSWSTLSGATAYDQIGEVGVPLSLAVLLGLASAALVIQGILRSRGFGTEDRDDRDELPSGGVLVAAWAGLFGYTLILPWVGFLLLTPLLAFLMLWLSHFRSWPPALGVSVGVTVVVWLVFSKFLGIILPTGVIPYVSTL